MSDAETKAQEESQKAAEAAKKTLEGKSTSELIDIIHETRTEAKDRRLKQKELEERLNAIETDKQKAEQDKKIAEGKKDEVITDLTKKYEEANKKASQWDEYNKKRREKIKEQIKDKWLDSFNVIPLDELEILAKEFVPDIKLEDSDNGTGKKKLPGKLEGLQKDLELAISKKDVQAQMAIKRLIEEEKRK